MILGNMNRSTLLPIILLATVNLVGCGDDGDDGDYVADGCYEHNFEIENADDLEELRPCLEQLVPIVQQAVVDYVADPTRANAIIVDAVEQYQDFWIYSPGLAEYSFGIQVELGLVGNGPDELVGNLDPARVQAVIDQMTAAGLDVAEGLQASDIGTNEFIDASIGLP